MALSSSSSSSNYLFAGATSPQRSPLCHQRLLLRSPRKQNGVWCAADRRELFTRIAPVYDNLNDLLSLGQHRIWKKMCVSWSGAKEGDIVLDLCCGSGDLTFLLSQKVGFNGEVSALDFSSKQLFIASTRQGLFWKACYKNIKWIEDDALDLPFEDSYFNAVTVSFGLRNLIDKRRAMQEIFRILKPGSKVSILDFNKSTSFWTSQYQEWMLDNVVVPIASTYNLSEEYNYIKSSVAEFLTGKELEKLAREVGFSDARHYEFAAGLMGNLVGTR